MNLFGQKPLSAAEEEIERKAQEEFRERFASQFGEIKTDKQAEVFYNGNLMMVGTHLTHVCHSTGASPEEVLATYARLMDGLMDWFSVVPMREKVEEMLDDTIKSRWSVKEQPVMPLYTPKLKKMGNNSDDTWNK